MLQKICSKRPVIVDLYIAQLQLPERASRRIRKRLMPCSFYDRNEADLPSPTFGVAA
jgi:hypothetical protein